MSDFEDWDIDTFADLLDEDLNESCLSENVTAESPLPQNENQSADSNIAVAVRKKKLTDVDLFSSEINTGDATPLLQNENQSTHSNIAVAVPKKKLRDVDLFSSETNTGDATPKVSNLDKNCVYKADDGLDSSDEETKTLTEEGRSIKKRIAHAMNYKEEPKHKKIITWKDKNFHGEKDKQLNMKTNLDKKVSCMTDSYSGIRIINPLVPFNVLQQRMEGRRMIKMSFIRNSMRGGDIEGDWVTTGVVVNKLPPKSAKNGKAFSIWKMTDLHDTSKILSVFLFGAAHVEHWKTAIGTVIGILNPSIMPDKDKNGEISLSVDHAGKLMIMGASKDFGHCKGTRKDGVRCSIIVNKAECEYCPYHIKKAYNKLSSKRVELQTSYSGREPNLKNRILKGQNIIYGGQMFSSTPDKKPTKQNKKDKLTLSNLGLKRKAEELEMEERSKMAKKSESDQQPANIKKLTEMYGPEISDAAVNTSKFINEQLSVPSVGSRNFAQFLIKDQLQKTNKVQVKSVTARELLKQHEDFFREKLTQNKRIATLDNLMPQLGKGLSPRQSVNFDASPVQIKKFSRLEVAKLKAIQKVQEKGPLTRKNPNAVKNPEAGTKAKANLDEIQKSEEKPSSEENVVNRSRLGSIDLNSEEIQKILKRKSSHAHEVEAAEIEKQEVYFRNLEKKEQMEQKMATTMEIVCDVVSCKQCKYTAHQAADLCKDQGHPLKCHKAIKRFFCCKDCHWRSFAFTKLPTKACRNCGGSSFERTSMKKPRSGPKLDSEVLNIRGDEIKYLNSLRS